MFGNISGWHALIVIGIVLLLAGATRLPALARSIGQSMRILKEESRTDETADATADSAEADAAAGARESVGAGSRGS